MNKHEMDWLSQAIVYEDDHLIAINKPAGTPTQADKTGDLALNQILEAYLESRGGKYKTGLAHRLDRRASGLVLFSKTHQALKALNATIQNRSLQKTYWAVSKNPPPDVEGTLENWLLKNQSGNKSYITKATRKHAKKAVLHYQLLGKSDRYNLLQVQLKTGRHHQIRVQLAQMGCPIKGDLKYGAKRSNKDGSIHLHAIGLRLLHPVTGKELTLTANPSANDAIWSYFVETHGGTLV